MKLSQEKLSLYTELNVNRLETLARKVADGAATANTITKELEQIANELREINNNFI